MPQIPPAPPAGQTTEYLPGKPAFTTTIDINTAFPLSTANATVMIANSISIKNSIFVIENPDGAITENYFIFGSLIDNPNFSNTNSAEWVNMVSVAAGGTYNHALSSTVVAGARAVQTFTNPYQWVIVVMNSVSGTPNVNVYHRGYS